MTLKLEDCWIAHLISSNKGIKKANLEGGSNADCLAIDLMLHMVKHGYTYEDLVLATKKLEPHECEDE